MAVARQPPVEVLYVVMLRAVGVAPVRDHQRPFAWDIPQRAGIGRRRYLYFHDLRLNYWALYDLRLNHRAFNLYRALDLNNLSLENGSLHLHDLRLDDRPFNHLRVDDRCGISAAASGHDRRHGQRCCDRCRIHQPSM